MRATLTQARADAIAGRLRARARTSIVRHQPFHTVRREDLRWQPVAPGCEAAVLIAHEQAEVALLHLAPGAAMPWPQATTMQELLVLDGELLLQPAGAAPQSIGRHGLVLRCAADAGRIVATGEAPVRLYARRLRVAPAALPAPERGFWLAPRPLLHAAHANDSAWQAALPGIDILPLAADRQVVSMLVRLAPGARVPDHEHAVHEDCFMLEGEFFLGDRLLRAGDYQFAPAGCSHFDETSDGGGLLFVHGAFDEVLLRAPAVERAAAR